MGKSIIEVIELEGVHGLHNDEKMLRGLGVKLKAVEGAIYPWDEEDSTKASQEAERALEDYATSVDEMVSTLDERSALLKSVAEEGQELLAGISDLIALIPRHVVLEATSDAALKAEAWRSDNAVGDYHFVSIRQAAIVVFDDEADWTLFKVRFGA